MNENHKRPIFGFEEKSIDRHVDAYTYACMLASLDSSSHSFFSRTFFSLFPFLFSFLSLCNITHAALKAVAVDTKSLLWPQNSIPAH